MEVAAVMGGVEEARRPVKLYYYDHVGWEGATWGGVYRGCFIFSDSLEVGGYLEPGCGEGRIAEHDAAYLARVLPTKWFAGIVCVADSATRRWSDTGKKPTKEMKKMKRRKAGF